MKRRVEKSERQKDRKEIDNPLNALSRTRPKHPLKVRRATSPRHRLYMPMESTGPHQIPSTQTEVNKRKIVKSS
jgi:hypothetical protein